MYTFILSVTIAQIWGWIDGLPAPQNPVGRIGSEKAMKFGGTRSLKSHYYEGGIELLVQDLRKFLNPVLSSQANPEQVYNPFLGDKMTNGMEIGFMVKGVDQSVQWFIPEILTKVM
jgi:hypothetical protein